MFKPIIQFLLVFLFSTNLYSQNIELEIIEIDQHIERSEINEAEAKLNKILSIDPSYAPGYVSFSKIWLSRANINKATEHANLAVRIDEDFRYWWEEINSFRTKIKTGNFDVNKKKYNSAIEIFSSLSKEYPKYPEPLYLLGLAHYKQKSFKKAAKFFKQSIDLFPNYIKAQKALSNVNKRIRK
jgi:tetratricopeptide (TPR) repeat protein